MSPSDSSFEGEDDPLDDLPSIHLDDDEYDAYVADEFDAEGNVKEGPRVGMWIALFGVFALLVAILLLR